METYPLFAIKIASNFIFTSFELIYKIMKSLPSNNSELTMKTILFTEDNVHFVCLHCLLIYKVFTAKNYFIFNGKNCCRWMY